MASKYLVTVRRSHIFNPAAIAAVVVGLLGLVHATWWVGTASLLPFTVLLGLLIVRKVRRFRLLGSFLLASLVLMLLLAVHHGQPLGHSLINAFTSWPLVFFGTIMLTEPATMPATDSWRLAYGCLTGLLFAAQLKVGPLYTTPEVALVLGNLFAFAVSPRQTLVLRLKEKRQLAPRLYDFIFEPDQRPVFTAGQYLQLTLPHAHVDGRGNRHTFTIASSPTEPLLRLGIKFYEPSSSFKRQLQALNTGDTVQVGQFAGDFSLPKDPSEKLVFIAGGIGVTPFRSMLRYLIDTKQLRDIVLFYVVSDAAELVYRDDLDKARAYGLKVAPLVGQRITKAILQREVPDYASRTYYISGPNAMVENLQFPAARVGRGSWPVAHRSLFRLLSRIITVMLLLLISFIAGILTVLAPCVLLPLLPVIVGGSVSARAKEKARPYIIAASLAGSIIGFTLLLKVSTVLINLSPNVLNYVSGGLLVALGVCRGGSGAVGKTSDCFQLASGIAAVFGQRREVSRKIRRCGFDGRGARPDLCQLQSNLRVHSRFGVAAQFYERVDLSGDVQRGPGAGAACYLTGWAKISGALFVGGGYAQCVPPDYRHRICAHRHCHHQRFRNSD